MTALPCVTRGLSCSPLPTSALQGGILTGSKGRPSGISKEQGLQIETCAAKLRHGMSIRAAKGFGAPKPPPPPRKKEPAPDSVSSFTSAPSQSTEDRATYWNGRDDNEEESDSVPEVVTNRMLKRIFLATGIPLALGLILFPAFYWLKVVQKVDLPEWVPLVTSTAFFGVAGLGISYGVLSTSWDPAREGTLLGWKEAQVNWPVFFKSLEKDNKR
eukprot:TRINITY_DN39231_c0_g1_i1.p1 TRINITY_DN39231_c0_g1~~TRINITY_DN39231_c0_g1_i1.p1  ORF type:complete len:215 (-),score=25.11 TRINITY_DN39231_c0_g1_i1:317-961(-)